jgi:uncharacterized protein
MSDMDTPTLLARLKAMEPELRERGVGALYLFGSRARGDHREDSDVDLLFEVDERTHRHFSYFDLFGARDQVAEALALSVELIDRRALHPYVKSYVEPDLVQVF